MQLQERQSIRLALAARVPTPWRIALLAYGIPRLISIAIMAVATLIAEPKWPDPGLYMPSVREALSATTLSRFLLLPWYRWDTIHYLHISLTGYEAEILSVWPPLYPLLVRAFSVFMNPLLAALVVSGVSAVIAYRLLYQLVAEIWDEVAARRAVVLMAVFPTAFYFQAAYTESLFVALALGCFLAARRRQWLLAGALAALATLSRNQGILLGLPIAWQAWQAWKQSPREGRARLLLQAALGLALPALAFAAFAAYVHFGLHYGWPWQTLAEKWKQEAAWPWDGVAGTITALLGRPLKEKYSPIAMSLDLFTSVLATWLLSRGLSRLPDDLSLFAWAMLLVSLTKITETELLVSLSRYTLSIFPIFIVQALEWRGKPLKAWLVIASVMQAALVGLYYAWGWIA